MSIFSKKAVNVEVIPINQKSLDLWFGIFNYAMQYALTDLDEVRHFESGDNAVRLASAARNIADAAVEEYEARWGK